MDNFSIMLIFVPKLHIFHLDCRIVRALKLKLIFLALPKYKENFTFIGFNLPSYFLSSFHCFVFLTTEKMQDRKTFLSIKTT